MMIHFILPGDTIEKIAKEINLENPVYLKDFHNQHCAFEDRIVDELQPGKKLFIPSKIIIDNYNARNDAPFKRPEQNPVIVFNPETISNHYKVNIVESSNTNGNISKTEFSYFVNLRWIQTEMNEHLFHFSKDRFSNIHRSKMEFMAIEVMKTIYPLHIFTNLKGEISRIEIPLETIKKFKKDKERLLDLFPDPYAKIYINEFECAISNQENLKNKIKEDWFLKLFFASFRTPFKDGKSTFPLKFYNKFLDIHQTAKTDLQQDEIIIKQNGSQELSSYNAELILTQNTGLIKKINAFFSYVEFSVVYTTNYRIELA